MSRTNRRLWIWVEMDDDAAAEEVFTQNTRSAWNTVDMAAQRSPQIGGHTFGSVPHPNNGLRCDES